jgi:hypothetical protein
MGILHRLVERIKRTPIDNDEPDDFDLEDYFLELVTDPETFLDQYAIVDAMAKVAYILSRKRNIRDYVV